MMTEALAETLSMLALAVESAEDAWWLIGSAAVALHGGTVPHIKDVDMMMSARDAEAFLNRVGGRRGGGESDRFQSLVFGIWTKPPIPVEAFGGFQLNVNGMWREVTFTTREPVTVRNTIVYVPSAEELIRLLRSFGRPKDLERASLLRD